MSSATRDLPVNFSSFVVSLAAAAMLHLGETPDPSTGRTSVNLPLARNSIDVLSILEEKTRGNLDEEEQSLLDTLLADLREKLEARTGG